MTLGRPANRALIRRVSVLWLCGACVLLAVGASPAGASDRARTAAASGCCFKLSIYDFEGVIADYNVKQSSTGEHGFRPTITGTWYYTLAGTAYGLAVLKPWGLLSLYGGVAAGQLVEENFVVYHPAEGVSEPFGCTKGFGGSNLKGFGTHGTLPFERAEKPNPEYVAPANGGSGDFDFGAPFDRWASECPSEGSTAESQIKKILGSRCSNVDLLSNPSPAFGGPICGSNLNPYKTLSGEHKVNRVDIKCTEDVAAEKEGYSVNARVTIVIVIVRVDSKERKHQERTLSKFHRAETAGTQRC